ncbi:MAG: adenosylcobinamide-GDP ribazoletransferase [Ketobacter sp.]
MNALLIALQFLTRLPVPATDYNPADSQASIYWYAVVGLIIGTLLWLSQALLLWIAPQLNNGITAAVLLCLWVLLTGALHLDGLADSADAWLGGTTVERTLAIMKDPRSGAAGVTSIVLLLLLKFACLQQLLEQATLSLLLAPALARSLMPVLFLHTPYVREDGLATPFSSGLSSKRSYLGVACISLLWCVWLGPMAAFALLPVGLVLLGLRSLMLARIGGTTGDTAGAAVEILEAVALLAMVIMLG